MDKSLSIKTNGQSIDINTNKSDIAAALARAIIGAAPAIGPLMAEVITNQIPNQKLERVVRFMVVLEDRLGYVEKDVLNQKFLTEEFGDLLEDALPQAARALTEERRQYIANLLTRSLTDDELDHVAQKRLLARLNAVNDAELVLLKFYSLPVGSERDLMISKYPFIRANLAVQSKNQPNTKEDIMFEEYWGHLVMTSLVFGNQGQEEKPTKLGLVLLNYVGLIDSLPNRTDPS